MKKFSSEISNIKKSNEKNAKKFQQQNYDACPCSHKMSGSTNAKVTNLNIIKSDFRKTDPEKLVVAQTVV